MSIGERVREARKRRGISQSQLSRESGIAQGTISRCENDINVPGMEVIRILADALGVRYYDLILSEEDKEEIRKS